MKNIIIVSALCIPCIVNGSALSYQERQQATQAAFTQEINRSVGDITAEQRKKAEEFQAYLLAKYKPTQEHCGPDIIAAHTKTGYATSAKTVCADVEVNKEKEFACMLAGYKQVYFGSFTEFYNFSTELKDLFKLKQFDYLKSDFLYIFTPAGRKNALLLLKEMTHPHVQNSFSDGLLLGYTEQNIRAYYKCSLISRNPDADMQEAVEWIQKNEADIETWAAQHVDAATKSLKD